VRSQVIPCKVVVDRVALGQVSLRVLRFVVSVTTPVPHTHLGLHVALTRKTTGEVWEPSRKEMLRCISGTLNGKVRTVVYNLQKVE
jgi:hypothetical protein